MQKRTSSSTNEIRVRTHFNKHFVTFIDKHNHIPKPMKYNEERLRQTKIVQEMIDTLTLNEEDLTALQNLLRELRPIKYGTISKGELAKLYNINMVTLNKRMLQMDGLIDELHRKYGYTKWRKFLMPAEVELIRQRLGDFTNPLIPFQKH